MGRVSSFKAEYFIGGLCILIPLYLYIHYMMDDEENFSLKNFNRDIIIDDIKKYRITGKVDLSAAIIESYIFGIGKDQNDYVNIFYNKINIEFVKTKITFENYNKSTPTLTAFTNIDQLTLKEIFQKYASTKVYFDKYIPTNYYIDLEFLEDLNLNKEADSQINFKKN
jgi:hypothetical protein